MALAGRYDNDEFDEAIRIIQMGQQLMPAYEQQIDRAMKPKGFWFG